MPFRQRISLLFIMNLARDSKFVLFLYQMKLPWVGYLFPNFSFFSISILFLSISLHFPFFVSHSIFPFFLLLSYIAFVLFFLLFSHMLFLSPFSFLFPLIDDQLEVKYISPATCNGKKSSTYISSTIIFSCELDKASVSLLESKH